MKYLNWDITFSEIPDEVSLAINITNCPNTCPGCHSPILRKDIGIKLDKGELDNLLCQSDGITCILFLGGDGNVDELNDLAYLIKSSVDIKVAWYSGCDIDDIINPKFKVNTDYFDYIKVGSYKESLGPLTSLTTNQHLYKKCINDDNYIHWSDITYLFWRSI